MMKKFIWDHPTISVISVMRVKVKRLRATTLLPTYAHGPSEDAGMDLYAAMPAILRANIPQVVPAGFAIELPPGFEGQIRPRSGLATKYGVTVANSPGTVDPSYRGEVGVSLIWNGMLHSEESQLFEKYQFPGDGSSRFVINVGDRIAQMVVTRYEPVALDIVDELSDTSRGDGGFGSTGTR